MEAQYGLHIGDYVVFAGMISVSIIIGIYYAFSGGRQKTTFEYLVGNRQMKAIPVALSLVATYDSSILMLGFPAEVYTYGTVSFWNSVAILTMMLLSARIMVPLIYPLKLKSLFQWTLQGSPFHSPFRHAWDKVGHSFLYFDLRYQTQVPRKLGTVIGMLYYIFYIGIVLYGPAIALEAVADFPFWASVFSSAAAAMIYTSLGGLKGVVWADVVQCATMVFGMLAVAIKGSLDVGGISKVWDINYNNLRLKLFDFDPDPLVRHTFWSLYFGSMCTYCNMAFSQATSQRISSVRNIRDAKRTLFIAGPLFMIINNLAMFEGLVIFAYFNVIGCDPIKSGQIENMNQILPHMVIKTFKSVPGLAGLFFASLFSASLSTISSSLNSLSAQTVEDFIKPRFPNMTDSKSTVIAKISVILYGLLALGITVMIAKIPTSLVERVTGKVCTGKTGENSLNVEAIVMFVCSLLISGSLLTSFAGPLAGLFVYSVFCPWATSKGFLTGGLISMTFVLWISLGSNFLSARPNQPWLPLNPIFTCPANSSVMLNTTDPVYSDTAMRIAAYEEAMLIYSANRPKGIDNLYSLSYRWFGAIGLLTSVLVGSTVSLITGYPRPDQVDTRYMLPLGDTLFPYLPKSARRWLEFGADFKERKKWLLRLNTYSAELVPSSGQIVDGASL